MVKRRAAKLDKECICQNCGVTFVSSRKTKRFCSRKCIKSSYSKTYIPRKWIPTEEQRQRIKVKAKERRKANLARTLYMDSKACDKRKGFTCDISYEFVANLLLQYEECQYCGSTEERPSLDRIDNELGHTKENIIRGCSRCNYMRRDIPYPAWLLMVPAVREARVKGLLDNYKGFDRYTSPRTKRRK